MKEKGPQASVVASCYGVKYDQDNALISPHTMVQRMMLITGKVLKFEFGFAKNIGIDKDFKHL